ncbi:MAG: penicillin-binding protein 1A [Alphaproteobacteria bacterium]|nr:penicillin-binding protein 1A [Alphaproteobacteria bacterium]
MQEERFLKIGVRIVYAAIVLVTLGVFAVGYVLLGYSRDLPDVEQLANYEPPVVTRLHAADGRLIAEYAKKKRIFVPIKAIPKKVVAAFLSAEDKSFFTHPGIDVKGIIRAAITNIMNVGKGRRLVGASTITQQVTKNFLLTSEVSIERKVKEAILAFRIEKAYDKSKILELYLNEIYLGFGSYGVASAALEYFNKSLSELTVAEAAYLAALPKAPANYHPVRRTEAAISRRNWVIGRMQEDGAIAPEVAAEARSQPIEVADRAETEFVRAGFFSEDVRRELLERYGESGLYSGGLTVRTTLDPRLQEMAVEAVRFGLNAYDRRHGWRGPIARLEVGADWPSDEWQDRLEKFAIRSTPVGLGDWRLALVLRLNEEEAQIGFRDGTTGIIPIAEMKWARDYRGVGARGPAPKEPADVLGLGFIVPVSRATADKDGNPYPSDIYRLEQIPAIQGALVAMDPHTGRVLAMVGGYAEFSKDVNEFNRASQGMRQPGSAIKPFVYLTALDNGFTPSSLVLDAPFVIDQGGGLGKWKPQNYKKKFYGPSTLRIGVEKSRNVMTVRLAQSIGMDQIAETAQRFGIVDYMPRVLSQALGAGETTLLRLTTAYAMLVNGGKGLNATLIDRVQDRDGRTIFRHDSRPCEGCRTARWEEQPVPGIPDIREQIADPRSVFQIVSILEGAVQRGTGKSLRVIGKPLAGKTGTTNESVDTWFMGFSPDLVTGVWVGFDQPATLGKRETGARVAAPVFREFMQQALADQPATPFRVAPNVTLVKVNATTGLPAKRGAKGAITEVFKIGETPYTNRNVVAGNVPESMLTGGGDLGLGTRGPSTGTGGLY